MISFRFHLVSVVAVFLALGVGVAMGASFVDRATVDTMRNRLDQLEGNYRERGVEIEAQRDQMTRVDQLTGALIEDGSAAVAGRLADRPVVLIADAEVPAEASDAVWSVLGAAGAHRSGTLRVEPTIDLEDEAVLTRVRTLLELDSAVPSLVRGRLMNRLSSSLAVLTASAPDPTTAVPPATVPEGEPGDGTGTPSTEPPAPTTTLPEFRPLGPVPSAEEIADARAFVAALVEVGIVSIDTTGAPAGAAFPNVEEVSYVVVVADGSRSAMVSVMHRLARGVAESAPMTLTVAEGAVPRRAGTVSTADPDRVGAMLVEVRNDDAAADRLSTVDGLAEVVGRVALVLAVEEQFEGRVGHYGTGVGATSVVPKSPG